MKTDKMNVEIPLQTFRDFILVCLRPNSLRPDDMESFIILKIGQDFWAVKSTKKAFTDLHRVS